MRYILVDRFLEIEKGKRARAVKCVTLGEPFLNDLREQAVLDAMAKAQQFASLTGVALGQLVFISESGSGRAIAQDFARVEFAMAAPLAAAQTSISGGELELKMNVQAVFAIQ